MANTTGTFGATNQYGYSAPAQGRIFAFSPSYIQITGTAPLQEVTLTASNGVTFKRTTDSANKCTFPLMYVLKSFFASVDVGDVIPMTIGNFNAASKLMQKAKTITLKVGADTNTLVLTYDILFGALQVAEIEPTNITIYRFGTLPLTVMQDYGNYFWDDDGSSFDDNLYGKDVFPSLAITQVQFKTGSTIHKTINISDLSYCSDGVYLRWVDRLGQYKYYQFKQKSYYNETTGGDSFNKELLSLEPTSNGLYKSQKQLIDIEGNPVQIIGLATATYEQQKHIQSLESSIKAWKYLGSNKWVEVEVKMKPIELDEMYQQNQSVELQITLPNLYLQSL